MPPTSKLLRSRSLGRCSSIQMSREIASKRILSLGIAPDREFQNFFGGDINSLDVEAHDGRYLLAGGSDASVALYDLRRLSHLTGQMKVCEVASSTTGKTTDSAHQYSVETITWFPHDTGMFVTSGMDHCLKIWDTNAWAVAEDFTFDAAIYSHAISPGSSHTLIAVGRGAHDVKLCDMTTGSTTQILRGHSDSVLSVAWSPRNDFHLVSGGADNKILMWDVRQARSLLCSFDQHNGRQQLTFEGKLAHAGYVTSVKFTSDGLHVVSLGTDRRLRLWDALTAENTLVNYGPIYTASRKSVQLAIAEDCHRRMVFVPADMKVECFDLYTGRKLQTMAGHFGRCGACTLIPNRQELLSGAKDKRILWWASPAPSPCVNVEADDLTIAEKPAMRASAPAALQDAWSSDEGD